MALWAQIPWESIKWLCTRSSMKILNCRQLEAPPRQCSNAPTMGCWEGMISQQFFSFTAAVMLPQQTFSSPQKWKLTSKDTTTRPRKLVKCLAPKLIRIFRLQTSRETTLKISKVLYRYFEQHLLFVDPHYLKYTSCMPFYWQHARWLRQKRWSHNIWIYSVSQKQAYQASW